MGQPAKPATSLSGRAFVPQRSCVLPFQSRAAGVGHPVEPLADVRSADARSAEIERRAGVALSFQVSLYSVPPAEAVRARNLLSKDDRRAALADEVEADGPEVALVVFASALAGGREGLAGEGRGPDGAAIGPSGEAEGVRPDADAGEEVDLSSTGEIHRSNIDN